MNKKKLLPMIICIVLSLIMLFFIYKDGRTLNDLYLNRNDYSEEVFSKYFILNCTQLSCVIAILINIWTTYLLFFKGQVVTDFRLGKYFNVVEIIYLVISTLISLITYIVIVAFDSMSLSWKICSNITTLNMSSIGFLGASIIIVLSSKKKNKSE